MGAGSVVAVFEQPDTRGLQEALRQAGCPMVLLPDHAGGARLRIRLRHAVAAVTATDRQAREVAKVAGELTHLRLLWSVEAGALDELAAAAAGRLPATFTR